MKLDAGDIKRFLTKTELFTEAQLESPIRQVKISEPLDDTTLIAFVWNSVLMGLLFDENAEDETEVLSQVKTWGRPTRLLTPKQTAEKHFMLDNKVVYLLTTATTKTRLDQKLAELELNYSRSQLAKFIKNGHVTVNGRITTKPGLLVNNNDNIRLVPPQKMAQNFTVLFEDKTILAIDKPAGVLSHNTNQTNPEWTIDDFAKTKAQLADGQRIIAHRLDRDTSGVILAAKTEAALHWLQKQFANRQIEKVYYAVVNKKPPYTEAVINLPLQRSLISPGKFEVNPNGREAITALRLVKQSGQRYLLELRPKTGRTHQLRVHLKHIGCPIIGDKLYGGSNNPRLMLHASEVKFTNQKGKTINIKSPLPNEFNL